MVTEIHAALGFDNVPLRLRKPPVAQPRPNWRHYFPVAAAVILVIALLGASFSTLVPGSGPNDQFASVPPVVLGLVSPSPELMQQITTHEPKPWACNSGRELPVVVTYSNDFPDDGGIRHFNLSGSRAMLRCHDSYTELIVREGNEVRPTYYPNIFLIDTGGSLSLLNITSISAVYVPTVLTLDELERFNLSLMDSRWMVVPDLDYVVDTWTMDVIALNAIIGITTDMFFPTMTGTNDDGTMNVVAVEVWNESGPATHLVTLSSDASAKSVEISSPPADVLGLAVSPAGDRVIIRSSKAVQNSPVDVFEVVDLTTGEVSDRIEFPGDLRTSDPVWIDNDTFVFTNTGALHKATLGSADTEVLYDEPGTGLAIYKTRDPNVVTLVQQRSNTSQDQFEGTHAKKIITVNTSTGKTTEYIGVDQTLSPNQEFVFTRNVILLETEPSVRSGAELHVQVIDPVTGEVVGRIDREDTGLRDGAIRSGGGVSNGDMRFFSWGSQHTYQVTTTNGHARLERIPPPPGQASESDMAVGIRTAPDASWIAMHIETADEWWFLDLTDPDATWVQLPDNDGVYSVVLEP